jgi:hypothetical protein
MNKQWGLFQALSCKTYQGFVFWRNDVIFAILNLGVTSGIIGYFILLLP